MGAGTLSQGDAGALGLSPVGIVVATAAEARCLDARHWRAGAIEQLHPDVFVIVSGMGAAAAKDGVQRLYDAGARAFVSFGSAAGLDPAVRSGALLLPERVWHGMQECSVDADWHASLLQHLEQRISAYKTTLVQVPVLLHDLDQKRNWRARTGAVGADMESAAVVSAATERGCPALIVRVVVDDAATTVPEWVTEALDANGEVRGGALWRGWLHANGGTGALLALAWAWRRAAASLRMVAHAAGPRFGLRP